MKKRIFALLLALSLLFITLVGCTPKNAAKPDLPADGSQNRGDETELAFPLTVTDAAGRSVTLEKPAERIVSCYYISTALLVALGLEDNLVGIEMKADTRELYKRAAPQLLELPAVGSGKGVNVEQTAAVEPELVILPAKLTDSAALFDELNIPVLVVDPETEESFEECALMLGKLCGASERAAELVAYYHDVADRVRTWTADVPRPKVYLSAGSSYLSTCPPQMYQNDLITIAGGKNVAEDDLDGDYWQSVSPEQLAAWNPDYIFAVNYAEYSTDDIYADSALADVTAVKEGRVYTFPSKLEAWDYPTPSSVLGMLWLASVLHPDLLPREAYLEEAAAFYQTYFDIDVSDLLEAE